MTTRSWAGAEVTPADEARAMTMLVDAHGVGLHRLAVMLTADAWLATELTARTLTRRDGRARAGEPGPVSPALLKKALVRHYLRSAPRRGDAVGTAGGDAGDVLRRLGPRARAACALRLVERWSTADTAAALGVRERRVPPLVPGTPGLELALIGLADQHALTGPDLRDALLGAAAQSRGPDASGGRRRWGRMAAAALPAALLVGYLAQADPDGGNARAENTSTLAAGTFDLTEAGWRLRDDGEPPRSAMGLQLRQTVTIEKGRRTGTVDLPAPYSDLGFASFGVLWCDMPPAQDDHLQVPAGTLTVDGVKIALPCAGRDGSPPVSQVVALPLRGEGTLEVTGDMPGNGVATLAVYTERDQPHVPSAAGSRSDAPPVDAGAVLIDVTASRPSVVQGRHTVDTVSVGHDSTVRVWAGRAGSVAISVDGVPVTDDGDLVAMRAMFAEMSQEDAPSGWTADPREHAEWSTQLADVRDGRWLVPTAGQMRTFALPPEVRPAAGERRTVTVEVLTENVDDDLQVAVSDAVPAEVDSSPVATVVDHQAPELVLGHRLLGAWELPSDGVPRELELDGRAELPEDLVLLIARDLGPDEWFAWGEGVVSMGREPMPLWLQADVDTVLGELRQPWIGPLPPGPGPLTVAAPAALGHPPATVLAYVPVAYEKYDFASAAVPPGTWPAGADPPADSPHAWYRTSEVIRPEDLEDGRVTVRVTHGQSLAARVTTEGKGRVRFLVEGQPADGLWTTDGWWSSWTDEPITSALDVAYAGGYTRSEIELTVVVEDYEDFTIEVLTD